MFGRYIRQPLDHLFGSLPIPCFEGNDYQGHEYVAKRERMIQLLCFLDGFCGLRHCSIGTSKRPEVTRQEGSNPVQVPKTLWVEPRQVNRSGHGNVCMSLHLAMVAGVKTRKGRNGICDGVRQGVGNLLRYRCNASREFFQAAKIPAPNLPLIKPMEEI